MSGAGCEKKFADETVRVRDQLAITGRFGSRRPSMVTSPMAISAMPKNSNSSSCSPRKIAPSNMALTGTISVTSEALVAPARATMVK